MAEKDLSVEIPVEIPEDDYVYDDEGTLAGWMVPGPKGGKLYRGIANRPHPNHRPGPGGQRKSTRQRILRLTDHAAQKLQEAVDRGLVCSSCGKNDPHAVTFRQAISLMDKGGKYSIGKPTDDDDGVKLQQPIVMLPPLAQGD